MPRGEGLQEAAAVAAGHSKASREVVAFRGRGVRVLRAARAYVASVGACALWSLDS